MPGDLQMLLEADTLVYDNDANTVTAVGGVQIEYGGNHLVAQRVVYNRKTGRVVASGNVQLVDGDGTKVYSDEIDITDDFANGFVNALRVETTDKTYFAAESAERKNGLVTTFNNGVYTACAQRPSPTGRRSGASRRRGSSGTARPRRCASHELRFELFGFPIIYMPVFEMADLTVKRKSGFLHPGRHLPERARFRREHPLLPRAVADLRPHAHRPLLHPAGFPRTSGVAPAVQPRRLQRQGCRHPPARSRRLRRQYRRLRPARRREPAARHDRNGGPVPDQSALGVRLERPGAVRQGLLQHLRDHRLSTSWCIATRCS